MRTGRWWSHCCCSVFSWIVWPATVLSSAEQWDLRLFFLQLWPAGILVVHRDCEVIKSGAGSTGVCISITFRKIPFCESEHKANINTTLVFAQLPWVACSLATTGAKQLICCWRRSLDFLWCSSVITSSSRPATSSSRSRFAATTAAMSFIAWTTIK